MIPVFFILTSAVYANVYLLYTDMLNSVFPGFPKGDDWL